MPPLFPIFSRIAILGAAATTAICAPPELKVVGNHLENKAVPGQVIRLTGVNVPSLGWGMDEHITESVDHALNVWKCNVIRLPINQTNWRAAGAYLSYIPKVDSVVSQAAAANAYVIIDLHGGTTVPSMPDDDSVAFWHDVALRYLNNPAVVFGIYNEPDGVNWEVWRNGGLKISGSNTYHTPGMQALVMSIRNTGANNLIIAGGTRFSADLSGITGGYALADTTSGNGIMYDGHYYPWVGFKGWAGFRQYPLLIGECGHDGKTVGGTPGNFGGSSPLVYWQLLGLADAIGASYTGWSVHPQGGPPVISDWNFTPTSASGQFVRNRQWSYRDPAHASTVANSGLETPATSSFAYRPSGANWTFTGNAGLQKTWGAAVAPGVQTAFLQTAAAADAGANGVDGAMSQNINFASPGTYAVSFTLAQRSGKAVLPITVSVDGVPISSVAYTPTSVFGVNAFGPVVTAPFTINSAGNHTVTLSATPSAGNDLEALIDNITVAKSAPAVVLNQGFQIPDLASNNTYVYRPTGANWTFAGNAGIERNAWGAPAAPEGPGLNSASGPQAAFLQTAAAVAGGANGTITQQIEFAAPGVYSLGFKAATRAGKGNLPIQILVDGVSVGTITPSSVTWADYATPAFTIITPGYHTVQLAVTPDSVMDNQAFIDAMVVTVPSAASTRPRPVPVAAAGFETPSPATGHGLQPTGTPWTFTGTVTMGVASGIQSDGSSFGSYDGRHAPEGWQTAFFSSSGTSTSFGTISQTVNFPTAGSYVICLQAQRGRSGANPVTITVDGAVVGTLSPPHSAFYPYTSNVFTVGAGNHTLTFTGSTASGVGVFTLIDAINIWPVGASVNLALNKTVTASSTVASGGWGVAKLTDGARGTTQTSAGWSSNSNTAVNHTEWVQIDLGVASAITQVVLYPRDDSPNTGVGFPIDFVIAGSTNGTTWTPLVSQTGYAPSTPPTGAQTFTFPAGTHRYVRVTGTNLRIYGSIYRMQFAEMEIY